MKQVFNPYLPAGEYIPDGEPHVFGNRVYVYGSHDRFNAAIFCVNDYVCYSAPVDDLSAWRYEGVIYKKKQDPLNKLGIRLLFAPDVVQGVDGRYYLYYAYDFLGRMGVAVSDKPQGPYEYYGHVRYADGREWGSRSGDEFPFDPGALVDDDGQVYIACGFERSFIAKIDPQDMTHVLDGTYLEHIIPCEVTENGGFTDPDSRFYEAASLRKIGDTYYFIYSPKRGSLAYATSDKPMGPYTYRGYIVDNGVDYPAGNNHGSICRIGNQWYIFYHRMTNGSVMSRRACVEKIEILPDGTIPPVEMTSLGFSDALNPYEETPAELACVLKGGALIAERTPFERVITNIQDGCVMGYKYFDFGADYGSKTMQLFADVMGFGCACDVHVRLDAEDGEEIGCFHVGRGAECIKARVKAVTGRHALYFAVTTHYSGWTGDFFAGRCLMEFKKFVFMK